jgi:hypothetical protein
MVTTPHAAMMPERYKDGRRFLRSRLDGTSHRMYGTKKTNNATVEQVSNVGKLYASSRTGQQHREASIL